MKIHPKRMPRKLEADPFGDKEFPELDARLLQFPALSDLPIKRQSRTLLAAVECATDGRNLKN
jgi:hypothetical protein